MAKITWLGEDELHDYVDSQGVKHQGAGPSFTLWNGVKFPKDVAVEVTNAAAIAKAKGNRFFKVEGAAGRPRKVEDDGGDKDKD